MSVFAGSFSPFQISNMSLFLDATDASTFTLDGSNVEQWNDKSGNGNHAVQATGVSQPSYANSRVTFDGNDFMTCPDDVTLRMGSGEFTLVTVVKSTQAGQQQRYIMKGRAGSAAHRRHFLENTAINVCRMGIDDATIAKDIICSTTSLNEDYIVTGIRNNTDQQLELYKNGVQAQTPTDIGAYGNINDLNPTDLYIGAETNETDFLIGDLQLVLIYKKRLLSWEISSLTNWINDNYSIG